MKTLGIIIVNWNSRNYLMKCLDSIARNINIGDCDVVVVDNDSNDGSFEMVQHRYPVVKIINSGGNLGFAKANNIGFRAVDCQYVLFLNPDTELVDDSVYKMANFLDKNPACGAVGPRMTYGDGTVQPLGLQWYPNPWNEFLSIFFVTSSSVRYLKHILPYNDPLKSGEVKKLYGGCILARKEMLDRINVFDERFFMYGEDVDLCVNIRNIGYKIFYMSEASIIHHCGGSSKTAVSQFSTLMKCESICSFMGKYYGKIGELCYKAIILSGSLFRLLYFTLVRLLKFNKVECNKNDIEYSIRKYRSMVMWSLNYEKPVIMK